MRILDRHVLAETLIAAGGATGAFVFILVAGNVVQQVVGAVAAGRVDGGAALGLVGLLIPTVLPYALPMGLLTGILIAFGRLGAEGEIAAMRSAGLSLWRIATPVWMVAACLALFSAWLNLQVGPSAEEAFERILIGAAGTNPASVIVPGRLNRQFNGLLIRAEAKEGENLRGFRLWQVDQNGRVRQALRAKSATVSAAYDAEGAPVLRIRIEQAQLSAPESADASGLKPEQYTMAEVATLEIPCERSSQSGFGKRLRMMTAEELVRAMDDGWQLPPGASPVEKRKEVTRLKVQLMFRSASALSVFSLAFLAVPLAVAVGRSDTNLNAALALFVALAYYLLTSAATWIKDPGWHPEVVVMLPNLIVLGVGFWLMRRATVI